MKKLTFAMAMMAAAGAATAGVSFSYQGALKTETGEDLPMEERNKTIDFRLYDAATGGRTLWGRAIDVCLNPNGLFNVELSDTVGTAVSGVDGSDLATVLADYPGKDKPIYIGLTVRGSAGEIRPRQKLMHVPTAAFAADVSQAKRGFTVNGGLAIASGTFTIGSGVTISRSGDTANGIVPRGVIVMWSGAANAIPAGWALCDGGNGTPDLRGRFIVGYNPNDGAYNNPGNTGGEAFHALSSGEMPNHQHYIDFRLHIYETESDYVPDSDSMFSSYGWGVREIGDKNGAFLADNHSDWYSWLYDAYKTNDKKLSTLTQAAGSGSAHENRPPYYTLCFIMKL